MSGQECSHLYRCPSHVQKADAHRAPSPYASTAVGAGDEAVIADCRAARPRRKTRPCLCG
jgi:hypothetical protein